MIIEEAIEKAEHNGYKGLSYYECEINVNEHILLDPSFWQSLGKAMGWWQCPLRHHPHTIECKELWLYKWHRLIDHLAEGKTSESFFENL